MRKHSAEKMRRTFYAWHGGQNSPLYAAASSGLVSDFEVLRDELRKCADSMRDDKANFRYFNDGKQSTMRAAAYREWEYLKSLADRLPLYLSALARHPHDGKLYRCLPWVASKERETMDWMPTLSEDEQSC